MSAWNSGTPPQINTIQNCWEVVLILIRELFDTAEEINVTGVTDNSKEVKEGDIFVCIKGFEDDGHRHTAEAESRGAAAIVAHSPVSAEVPVIYCEDTEAELIRIAQRLYGFPKKGLRLIGITGTNGKTTTAHIIKAILENAGYRTGIIGTNGSRLGEEEIGIRSTTPTTPRPAELWRIFAEMADGGAEYIVMEVSSHALELGRVRGCRFDVGVFTNLTQDHLDFHVTKEKYFAAKARLFEISDTAVINIDDMYGRRLASGLGNKKITFGFHDGDVTASISDMSEEGVDFTLELGGENLPVRLALPGKFSVYNALAAAGACLAAGLSAKEIQGGLEAARGIRGRMERIAVGAELSVIIDYAHSPDGFENILHTVRGFAHGRIIALFGCGGDRDTSKRAEMGRIAGALSDICVVTSDNPRTEAPMKIIGDILEGVCRTAAELAVIEDRRSAIEYALRIAKKGDIVLLLGKGQEDYQIIGREKIHFDEREIVREIYDKMKREKDA